MELSEIYQPSPLRKISNSTIQFRQLIQSLRNNHQAKNEIIQPPINCNNHKENESKYESTLITAQERTTSQNNNFLLHKQSDTKLQPKPKVQVGDRDKLKKKSIALDVNPELSPGNSRQISPMKLETSIHLNLQPSKDLFNTYISPRVNASTQYQFESSHQIIFNPLKSAREQIKTGQIVRQNLNKQEEKKVVTISNNKKIRDINENIVIQYLAKEKKLTNKSEPSEIFTFFTNLCLSCDIIVKNPSIKKFKNCVYYGFPIQQDLLYEGLLYFYDQKIYYGEFMNGFKHGLGIQLDLRQNKKMKGQFKQGRKTGKFYIEKPNQKYIGYLENGQYQGQGRLATQDYIYQGLFERGEKNGYGEQYYPKTGLKLTGIFRNGVLESSKNSKSIPQIRNKSKSTISKEKAKLELIRKRSLQKHNQRMNKIRQRKQQETEYQIEFNTTEEYDAPKIQVNSSKLEMYRQIPQKLPKICQQFQYSFQTCNHLDQTNSHRVPNQYRFQVPRIKKDKMFGMNERVGTSQLQEPLPTPCLTVLRSKR